MARDGGGGSPSVERRRVALRLLLAREEASSSSAPPAEVARPNKGLASAALRGLGCASAAASQAHAPVSAVEAVRSSEDWYGRQRRNGKERRKARGGGGVGGVGGALAAGGGVAGDVWCTCTPGIPFAAEASSVDCVVARHQTVVSTGRRGQAERRHRERPGAPRTRRVTMREHISSSFMDSPPRLDMPFLVADLQPSGHHGHMSSGVHHSHVGIEEEIMMFRTRLLLGRMRIYDQYQDWRVDVDNMTYEELLALEDRIGYVSTGLRENEIIRSIRMVKYSTLNPKHFSKEMETNCSICQEEFEANEEIGMLNCGHNYHVHCIKQWLSRKNVCPVCKLVVSKT